MLAIIVVVIIIIITKRSNVLTAIYNIVSNCKIQLRYLCCVVMLRYFSIVLLAFHRANQIF